MDSDRTDYDNECSDVEVSTSENEQEEEFYDNDDCHWLDYYRHENSPDIDDEHFNTGVFHESTHQP